MELFKRKKRNTNAPVQTAPSRSTEPNPYSLITQHITEHKPHLEIYRQLKESVPIIDAAISKIIRLTGDFTIECDNEECRYSLNKFLSNVHVNSCSTGANSFLMAHLNQLLTFGTAVGEIVLDKENENIAALYNSSLKNISLKIGDNPLKVKILKQNTNGTEECIKQPNLILISTLNPDPGHIYGNSIMKGLPFISNILLKIYNTIGINWERLGNVRFAVTYKPNAETGDRAYSRERAKQIATEWSKAMQSGSQPSDFIAVGDVSIKVIGADNQILESQVPVRQMLEQIISKLSIPPFLLGLNWSTTETMSTQQAEILSAELEAYRRMLNPIISKICDMWMRLNGFCEDYKIKWNKIDLKDHLHIANVRLTNAKAEEIEKRVEEKYGKH